MNAVITSERKTKTKGVVALFLIEHAHCTSNPTIDLLKQWLTRKLNKSDSRVAWHELLKNKLTYSVHSLQEKSVGVYLLLGTKV